MFTSAGSRQQIYGRSNASDASIAGSSANLLASSPVSPASSTSSLPFQPALRSQSSNSSLGSSASSSVAGSPRSVRSAIPSSISDKFSLAADPSQWGAEVFMSSKTVDPDDYLHNPDPVRDRKLDKGGHAFTCRGLANLGCLFILAAGLITLFAGYPLITFFTKHPLSTLGGFNIGGINATGQLASIPGNWALIDKDTPQSAYSKPSYAEDGVTLELVFSDEFNVDGRSFYPGDDPYWEAVDLHYWQTGNLEWDSPDAITTKNGALEISLTRQEKNNLSLQGGMMSTWNKFCFTGGLLEANVSLPGANNIIGLWPAVWAMGNLGRAGYGASLEGMWPYSYDYCDVGTAANQTKNGIPQAATVNGDPSNGGVLSFLPGQRLSRCTCQGESHPGPVHADGSYVGRSAPEIDVFEAQITGEPLTGQVSQSAQWAPFDASYIWQNTSANLIIPNPDITVLNPYKGGVFQQATSGVTNTNQNCYQLEGGCFSVYGFEYVPGFDNAYIAWISGGQLAWQLMQAGMGEDDTVQIHSRPVPQEPMYIIVNLGISESFVANIDLDTLTYPAIMRVDYIRVYQKSDSKNTGCDPEDFPTQAYINQYIDAYMNPNLTTWRDDYKQPFPKNQFLGEC